MKVIYSKAAQIDLDEILRYTAAHYPRNLRAVEARIRAVIARIASYPESARPVEDRTGVRDDVLRRAVAVVEVEIPMTDPVPETPELKAEQFSIVLPLPAAVVPRETVPLAWLTIPWKVVAAVVVPLVPIAIELAVEVLPIVLEETVKLPPEPAL